MEVKHLLCLFLITTVGFEVAFTSIRSSFGEECSRTRKCDRKAWLSCYDEKCDCSKPDEMHYEEEKGKCVTKSGERCKYGVEESGERSLVEITDCVKNSQCSEDGICVCDNKYHEIFNGTCALSKLFGEKCSEEDKCSQFNKLHCVNEVCSCQEGISAYSPKEGQCVGILNNACIDGKCFEGSECKDGICLCDDDHYEDSSIHRFFNFNSSFQFNSCLLRKHIHEKCSKDSECIHKGLFKLKCLNGICNCEDGYKFSEVQKREFSFYNAYRYDINNFITSSMSGNSIEICAPLVGRNCPGGYCISNARCEIPSQSKQNFYYRYRDAIQRGNAASVPLHELHNDAKCECMPEYPIANKNKNKCGLNFNSRCEINEDCVNNLVCLDRQCKCLSSDHQKVSTDSEYCITKTGGICDKDSICIDNSVCQFLPNVTVGNCLCNEGFVDSESGECDIIYGSDCNYNDFCDRAADLVCTNKKCSCKDALMNKYSASARKCLGLVTATCDNSVSQFSSCVDNARCSKLHPKLPAKCACSEGYIQNANFTCDFVNHAEL